MSKYTNYSVDHNVNVIPANDFRMLVQDTFKVITNTVGSTAGPYGNQVLISYQNQSTTTKDGYNTFLSMGFSDPYMRMVYLAIKNICERVNKTVGDGTTSCILVAEKLFNHLNDLITTPEDQRQLLEILSKYEKYLMEHLNNSICDKLNEDSLKNLISMASNNDKWLTAKLLEALDPEYDVNHNVVNLRNIIPEGVNNMDSEETEISIMQLPGDYQIRIRMEPADIEEFLAVRDNVRVVLYDHCMTETEWDLLEKPANNDHSLVIIARDFSKGLLDRKFVKYYKERTIAGGRLNVFPCWIVGAARTELDDLAAVLNTDVHALVYNTEIKYEDLPVVKMEIFNNNCMAFHIDKSQVDLRYYIDKIRSEMEADLSDSIVEHQKYLDRIEALKMETKETIITCAGTSSMETSMIMDKIDDCISIVKSAFKYGVVPNLLVYGYHAVCGYMNSIDKTSFEYSVGDAIARSIIDLFRYIYISKYGELSPYQEGIMNDKCAMFYPDDEVCTKEYNAEHILFNSFDIISEEMVDMDTLPTSAQYDTEVLVAAISIVKYLITSGSMIFGAEQMFAPPQQR